MPMSNLIRRKFGYCCSSTSDNIWVGASTMTGMRWVGARIRLLSFLRSLLENIRLAFDEICEHRCLVLLGGHGVPCHGTSSIGAGGAGGVPGKERRAANRLRLAVRPCGRLRRRLTGYSGKTWLEGRGTRFEKATGPDALEWLRGFEPQVTAANRVFPLSRFYEGADNPFACEEVVQWAREYRSRVRSGEITTPVQVSRISAGEGRMGGCQGGAGGGAVGGAGRVDSRGGGESRGRRGT